jgi:hypothetical protein
VGSAALYVSSVGAQSRLMHEYPARPHPRRRQHIVKARYASDIKSGTSHLLTPRYCVADVIVGRPNPGILPTEQQAVKELREQGDADATAFAPGPPGGLVACFSSTGQAGIQCSWIDQTSASEVLFTGTNPSTLAEAAAKAVNCATHSSINVEPPQPGSLSGKASTVCAVS